MNDEHATRPPDDDEQPAVTQPGLPLDDEPIPFALTAKARRVVAPERLPDLTVVGESGRPPSAGDADSTDRARARALRRAGTRPDVIARQLDRDELLVRAWVEDVRAPTPGARPGLRPVPSADRDATPARDGGTGERFAAAQRSAAATAAAELLDPDVAAGVGLLAGLADVDASAVTIRGTDLDLVAAAVIWLRRRFDVRRVRVVLQCGPRAAADLARHAWGRALGVDPADCMIARWQDAPTPTDVRALVQVPDPEVAGRLAALRDGLAAVVSGRADGLAF